MLLAAVMLSLAVSCEEKVAPGLAVSATSVGAESGFVMVSVTASGEWMLALHFPGEEEPWAELTTTQGRGSRDGILLRYDSNTSEASRTLKVLMTASGKDVAVDFVQKCFSQGGQDDPNLVPKWMELPAVEQNDDCKFYSHDMRLAGRTVRNYSFLWDRDNLVAHWVAYPLNSSLIGNGDRTDEWGYDPKVPKDEQPVLFNGFQGGYDRGHQLPSADRYTDNESTFYFTNMTPQLGSLNQKMWEALESRVRDWARTADTLYVVTGCVLEGSLGTARDNNGTAVTVPGGYFKAVLRYQPSSSIGYGGYVAAGFFFEHRSYGNGSITSDMGMSIDELEERTGLDFFVNLKEKYPTLADKIEAQDPATVGLWWN